MVLKEVCSQKLTTNIYNNYNLKEVYILIFFFFFFYSCDAKLCFQKQLLQSRMIFKKSFAAQVIFLIINIEIGCPA